MGRAVLQQASIGVWLALAGSAILGSAGLAQDLPVPKRSQLRLPVAVAPCFSIARLPKDGPETDADGYRSGLGATTTRPEEHITQRISSTGLAGAFLCERLPKETAPFLVTTVVTDVEHQAQAAGVGKAWRAWVRLKIQLRYSPTEAPLWTRYAEATAPAKGPLPASTLAFLRDNGLAVPPGTPLGIALRNALDVAIVGEKRPNPEEDTGGQLSLKDVLETLQWEALLIRRPDGRYKVSAGRNQGLATGVVLKPFTLHTVVDGGDEPELRDRKESAGQVRVEAVEENAAWVVGTIPQDVTGVVLNDETQVAALKDVNPEPGVPANFAPQLELLFRSHEAKSDGWWPQRSLRAKVRLIKPEAATVHVEVDVQDARTPLPDGSFRKITTVPVWVAKTGDSINAAQLAYRGAQKAISDARLRILEDQVRIRLSSGTLPKEFARDLRPELVRFLAERRAAWGKADLLVQGSATDGAEGVTLNLTFSQALEDGSVAEIAKWQDTVPKEGATDKLNACLVALRTGVRTAALPPAPKPTVPAVIQANVTAGDRTDTFVNPRQGFQLSLRLVPSTLPQGTQFPPDHEFEAEISSNRECWAMVFYVSPVRTALSVWPEPWVGEDPNQQYRPRPEHLVPGKPVKVPLVIGADPQGLGMETLVAVAWDKAPPAEALAELARAYDPRQNKWLTISRIDRTIRQVASTKNFVVDDEPQAVISPATPPEVARYFRELATGLGSEESPAYATSLLRYRSGPH